MLGQLTTIVKKSVPRIVFATFLGFLGAMASSLAAIVIALFTIFPWAPKAQPGPLDSEWNIFPLAGAVLVSLTYIALILVLVRFLRNPQSGLVLDKKGFTYWKNVFEFETVRWENVDRIDLCQDRFAKKIIGRFYPNFFPTVSVYTLSRIHSTSKLERFSQWMGFGDKVIMCQYLTLKNSEIFELMQTYLAASKYNFG